jgi:hypothetical protein
MTMASMHMPTLHETSADGHLRARSLNIFNTLGRKDPRPAARQHAREIEQGGMGALVSGSLAQDEARAKNRSTDPGLR